MLVISWLVHIGMFGYVNVRVFTIWWNLNIDFDFTVAHKQACSTEARHSPSTHTTITIEFKLIHKCMLQHISSDTTYNNHVSLIHVWQKKKQRFYTVVYISNSSSQFYTVGLPQVLFHWMVNLKGSAVKLLLSQPRGRTLKWWRPRERPVTPAGEVPALVNDKGTCSLTYRGLETLYAEVRTGNI